MKTWIRLYLDYLLFNKRAENSSFKIICQRNEKLCNTFSLFNLVHAFKKSCSVHYHTDLQGAVGFSFNYLQVTPVFCFNFLEVIGRMCNIFIKMLQNLPKFHQCKLWCIILFLQPFCISSK